MKSISTLLYSYLCSELSKMTEELYNTDRVKLSENPELCKPLTPDEKALVRLANYSGNLLVDPMMIEYMNLDDKIVKDIRSKILWITESLSTIHNNIVYIYSTDDVNQKFDIMLSSELLFDEINAEAEDIRYLCGELIKYSNVIIKEDFFHICFAIHNINFFTHNVQEHVKNMRRIMFMRNKVRDVDDISVPIERRVNFDDDTYLCGLKDKDKSGLMILYKDFHDYFEREYGYNMLILFESVIRCDTPNEKVFPQGSQIVVLNSREVAYIRCINNIVNFIALYDKSRITLVEGTNNVLVYVNLVDQEIDYDVSDSDDELHNVAINCNDTLRGR
ncbi:hypothetical protein [Ehrlichia canis]|uniref:Uncharacterized protein n=1 Tax=Ehrlichia canis (strain Jake) TaxID=269484 RepID=A0ACA6AW83_EHRCJ|nr:hypothetical protein [Ehrlichia canis]AAZ68788.1 hypothetical protein Ecaj_0756 [Ehrlichia canis str. Jake]AUO54484.1 hypothetical protein C1I72_01015 [Ehrlichia canis]UKC53291.1 hypothetical protein s20019040002_000334 [Ehrlichia canis]UKC54228.1 hypothetical protein s20026770001_000334 [Ehrlichia canis]UKC55164.1 hypothetical protein s21009500007_000334 [Ehrlichia canis]